MRKVLFTLIILPFIASAQTPSNLVPSSARMPELRTWIDAEEQSVTNGSAVTTVTDQAGVISGITVQGLVTLNISASGKKEFSFSGLDNSINLGQPAALDFVPGTDEFTIMGFIGSGVPIKGALVAKGDDTGSQYLIEVDDNRFWTSIGRNGGNHFFNQSDGLIDENIHFALVVSLNESKLYINGQLIETRSSTSLGTATYDEDILIGDDNTVQWDWEYSDHIRSVGLFAKALSITEIQAIYNDIINPNGGSNTGSEGYWTQNGTNIHFDSGSVGIGITDPGTYKLAVNGNIRAKEIKVETANWPDYVFDKNYTLPSLEEVQKHIDQNGHLINLPSAKEIEVNGLDLGEMNRLLLEKIEELTLYIIRMQNEINNLKKQ